MDAAWVGAVTTLLAGVLGLGGGVWVAFVARQAQIDVARITVNQALDTERRLLYAKFLRIAEEAIEVARTRHELKLAQENLTERIRSLEAMDPSTVEEEEADELLQEAERVRDQLAEMIENTQDRHKDLIHLRTEISVIAGLSMGSQAMELMTSISNFALGNIDDGGMTAALGRVIEAMHADSDSVGQSRVRTR